MMSLSEALSALTAIENPHDECYEVQPHALLQTVQQLKEEEDFNLIIDLTLLEAPEEMRGIYHFMQLSTFRMIRLEVPFSKEALSLPSLVSLFPAADEMERECYDLFGVIYEGHPNLTRILCPDDFEGHPLRKDYVSNTRD